MVSVKKKKLQGQKIEGSLEFVCIRCGDKSGYMHGKTKLSILVKAYSLLVGVKKYVKSVELFR